MSNNDQYLYDVVQTKKQSSSYSQNEDAIFNKIKQLFESSYNTIIGATQSTNSALAYYNSPNIQLTVQQSGSRTKGTAIKGKSDIDVFLSIYDPKNFKTLEQHFNAIYSFAKQNYNNVRKQNVSVGLEYYGYDVDIVPALRVNSQDYNRHNDHNLWSTKKQSRTLTNIQKHIDTVKNSGAQTEIILAKLWKAKHNIDIPSFYLELLVIDALKNNRVISIEQNFLRALRYIQDNIVDKKVIDPANSNNTISDTLTYQEKVTVANQAQKAIAAQYWSAVV